MRGAERTFAAIADCWPGAPVYTLVHDPRETGERFAAHEVHASYLQRMRVRQAGFRRLLPLYPGAIERIRVAPHRLLISSSSAFAHGLRAPEGTLHVCYCHTPFRYAWHERSRALAEVPSPARRILNRVLDRIQAWDLEAAGRVTHYIANSELTRDRIGRSYGRDSTVIHPPVEVHRFSIGEPHDYFLVVTELVRHKRVELALEACRRAQRPIKVVGTGPALEELRSRFDRAQFLGRVDDEELASLYAGARALIVPNVEEFGIAAVEAQAAGRPVVALDAGGVRETVLPGETGVLVDQPDPDLFAEVLRETDFDRFSGERISAHAATFSVAEFQQRLMAELKRVARAG